MTRKEEREKASVEYQMSNNPMCIGGDAFADMTYKLNINPSFIAGAEWADKTIIDKACEWLIDNIYGYIEESQKYSGGYSIDLNSLVNDFRKAMEE